MLLPSKLPRAVTPWAAANSSASPVGSGVAPASAASISLGSPDEVAALLALGVGVLGAVEAAGLIEHLAGDVVEGLSRHAAVLARAGDLVGVQVDAGELGVVVEHLLEVRHEPALVGGVAVEPAAQLVVHPPAQHGVERHRRHLEQVRLAGGEVAAQHEVDDRGLRELGRPAPAAVSGVEVAGERGLRRGERRGLQRAGCRAGAGRRLRLERGPQLSAGFDEFVSAGGPQRGDLVQDVGERRHAVAARGREVGAAVERHRVGREEHAHRPAAPARERVHGLHVDGVDVGALLAVDLDAHEVLVHQRRRGLVLEALVLHHVAPVTRRVPDAQEDRLVLASRALERLGGPGVPVHGVLGMLEEVGAGLCGEAVGHEREPLGRGRSRAGLATKKPSGHLEDGYEVVERYPRHDGAGDEGDGALVAHESVHHASTCRATHQ